MGLFSINGKEKLECLLCSLRKVLFCCMIDGAKEKEKEKMITDKEDIRINRAILHILDSTMGMPVLSDAILDTGSDFCDFLKSHIYRLLSGDDLRKCEFNKEESEVFRALQDYSEENFVPITQMFASMLFEVMNSNPAIVPGDFILVEYQAERQLYLAMLKMNYKMSYTHITEQEGIGNKNSITRHHAILPSEGQRLSEACFIHLGDFSIWLVEKKYEVNGEKVAYFSKLFLKCMGALSAKSKIALVSKAVDQVQKKYFGEEEQLEASMEAKNMIYQELSEEGTLNIPRVIDKIFKEKEEFKQEVKEKLDKYHISEDEVTPRSESTVKKFEKQCLTTDTGIELRIPMEQYQNPDNVQFITNEDGTISVLLKNIGHIVTK